MKTKTPMARKINKHLRTVARNRRPAPLDGNPQWPVERVDYAAGYYEATVAHGHTVFVSAETAESWLTL